MSRAPGKWRTVLDLWCAYAASEFLAMACNCGHEWLHLDSDWAVLEPVDVDLVRASEPPEQGARFGRFRQVIAVPRMGG